jgi:hypothetical protein
VCVFIDFFSGIVIFVNGVPIVLKQVSVRDKRMHVKKQRKEQRETEAKQSMKVLNLTGSLHSVSPSHE